MESISSKKSVNIEKEIQASEFQFHRDVPVQSNIAENKENNVNVDDYMRKKEMMNKDVQEPLQMELLYYTAALKELVPKLAENRDRVNFILWIKKLLRPEYQIQLLQEKRNKYLMMLALSSLNGEAFNILHNSPPSRALPEIETLSEKSLDKAEWETKEYWEKIIANSEIGNVKCTVHRDQRECHADHAVDEILDDEFRYLLYLTIPYINLYRKEEDRLKVMAWLDQLCCTQSCSNMKGIRNDYMMMLYGYAQELRIAGPFTEFPSKNLYSLVDMAKVSNEQFLILDPAREDVSDFLSSVPMPQEGAFCYIAVTGDLVESDSSHRLL